MTIHPPQTPLHPPSRTRTLPPPAAAAAPVVPSTDGLQDWLRRTAARTARSLAFLALPAIAAVSWPARADACALLFPPGHDVGVDREKAIIVWDDARHIEHFVRAADFHTTTESFGFLVPTPSRPTLGEVDDKVFDSFSDLTKADVVPDWIWAPSPVRGTLFPLPFIDSPEGPEEWASAGDEPTVAALEGARVAGLDATILAAKDSAGLSAWLADKGFEIRDATRRWLDAYAAKNWYIVAFRYLQPVPANRPRREEEGVPGVAEVGSKAVRISFSTDEPIYPYREPSDTRPVPDRMLHLFVVASGQMAGVAADRDREPWRPYLFFSDHASMTRQISRALPGVDLPARAWVSEFGDYTTHRPPTDIVFSPPLVPLTEVHRYRELDTHVRVICVPYELPFFMAGLAWWGWRRRARKREERARRTAGRLARSLACLALPVIAAVSWPARAQACGAFFPPGLDVGVNREKAVIVWDEARHIEHFVRAADFHTTSETFGFLVPTPSRPTLGEADDKVFESFSDLTKAEIIPALIWAGSPVQGTLFPLPFIGREEGLVGAGAPPPVTVLEETRIAGLDATILAAKDSTALSAWLSDKGFEIREATRRWLDVYVKKDWYIAAFRYLQPVPANRPPRIEKGAPGVAEVGSKAVRISFSTDEPIYPYREPSDTRPVADRVLHLFVVASGPMEGFAADLDGEPWRPHLYFSDHASMTPQISQALPGVDMPARAWVTELGDYAIHRTPTDIVFRPPLKSATEVHRRPRFDVDARVIYVPYELPFFVAGLAWWGLRRRARKRAAATARPTQ